MQDIDLSNGYGRIVTLDELTSVLGAISAGEHQWTLRLSRGKGRARRLSHVDIHYTNPELVDMPNALIFRFPVIRCPWLCPEILVCLHVCLADSRVNGLYWEGDELKHDYLEDFQRLWDPIRERL